MPKYNVDKAFWRNGHLLEVDSSVTMSKAEAKYLGHVLTEVDVSPAPAQAPAVQEPAAPEPVTPAVDAPVAGASVAEQPHEKPRHVAKNKRHRTDAANDAAN
jgi:hypothetical protein